MRGVRPPLSDPFPPCSHTCPPYPKHQHRTHSFGLLNYRALESVLTHYPDAKVRLLLAAPERANYYKYGNALSATQFEKYRKRGYHVELQLVGERELALWKEGEPGAVCVSVLSCLCVVSSLGGRRCDRSKLNELPS